MWCLSSSGLESGLKAALKELSEGHVVVSSGYFGGPGADHAVCGHQATLDPLGLLLHLHSTPSVTKLFFSHFGVLLQKHSIRAFVTTSALRVDWVVAAAPTHICCVVRRFATSARLLGTVPALVKRT